MASIASFRVPTTQNEPNVSAARQSRCDVAEWP
jgi:hypothetical protein